MSIAAKKMPESTVRGQLGSIETAIRLTILMPCLNEEKSLAFCIAAAQKFLAASGLRGEILIADNGSRDSSRQIAINQGARVIMAPKKGYGAAILAGIAAARGEYIIIGDADGSYDFTALQDFVCKLEGGYDLVIGNRFLGGIKPGSMPILNRYLGNPLLSGLARVLFKAPVGDFHCGLRAVRRGVVQQVGLSASGMEFASEMIIRSMKSGFRVTEVPTMLFPDRRGGPSHLRPWRDGLRHLYLIFQAYFRLLR